MNPMRFLNKNVARRSAMQCIGLAAALFWLSAPHASAQFTNTWIHPNGKFTRAGIGGMWQELDSRGQTMWHFKETRRTADKIELWDASRSVTVLLTPTEAKIYQKKKYVGKYNGKFTYLMYFSGNGGFDGFGFFQDSYGRWSEHQGGRKVFSFIELDSTVDTVRLYDASRKITVELGQTQWRVYGENNVLLFTKKGRFLR